MLKAPGANPLPEIPRILPVKLVWNFVGWSKSFIFLLDFSLTFGNLGNNPPGLAGSKLLEDDDPDEEPP